MFSCLEVFYLSLSFLRFSLCYRCSFGKLRDWRLLTITIERLAVDPAFFFSQNLPKQASTGKHRHPRTILKIAIVLHCACPSLVDVLACVLSRFLFVLDDQARFLLSLYCRQDSFERKEKRTLPEVQEEKNLAWKARQRRICSESQDIRYLLNARHDSFLRKERRFLLEVQVEHHVLSLFTRDYIYERLFVTCSFEHDDKEQ